MTRSIIWHRLTAPPAYIFVEAGMWFAQMQKNAITPDASTFMAIASSSDQAAQKANEAAKKVTQEDSIKEKFGQTEQGEEMIDKARETADKKLSSLAKKTQEKQDLEKLPPHEQNFLENLQGE